MLIEWILKETLSQAFNNNPLGSRLKGRPKNRCWNCVRTDVNKWKLKTGKRGQKQLTGRIPGMKILCISYSPTRGTCPVHMNLLDWSSVVMFVADHKSRGLFSCHHRSPNCTHRRNNVVSTVTRLQVALSGVQIPAVGGDLLLFAEAHIYIHIYLHTYQSRLKTNPVIYFCYVHSCILY